MRFAYCAQNGFTSRAKVAHRTLVADCFVAQHTHLDKTQK